MKHLHDEAAAEAELDARKDPAHPLYREPAYGAAAERYSACAKLGEMAVNLLRERQIKQTSESAAACWFTSDVLRAATALGLLGEEVRKP